MEFNDILEESIEETFGNVLNEEKFDIKKFIGACKSQLKAFEKSDNKEGVKFLKGIVDSYDKNGSLSPDQVKGASKFMGESEVLYEGKEEAKAIRTILKKKFPKTKFSVKTRSGGYSSAVDVRWKDSVPPDVVDEVTRNFEKYERDEATQEILSGGNTFVFTNREITDGNFKKLVDIYNKTIDEEMQVDSRGYGIGKKHGAYATSSFGKVSSTTDFDKKLTVKLKNGQYVGNSPTKGY